MTFNMQEHYDNRSHFPPEQLEQYYGRHVAWSLDGRTILASGSDDLQVFQAVKAAGLDPEQAVFSYVPCPDELEFGAALLFDQETEE